MPIRLDVTGTRLLETLVELSRLLRLQAALLDADGDHHNAADLRARASAYERALLAA